MFLCCIFSLVRWFSMVRHISYCR